MVALVDGQPRLLNLKEILEAFHPPSARGGHPPHHLRPAQGTCPRAHTGRPDRCAGQHRRDDRADQDFGIAGRVRASACWRASGNRGWCAPCSMPPVLPRRGPRTWIRAMGLKEDGYQLSEVQAQEILAMRLHRLTGLEQEKLTDEYRQILETIRGLIAILENPDRLAGSDPRRTGRDEGALRRRAPHRNPAYAGGPRDAGPDRPGRRGRHAVAHRLREAPAGWTSTARRSVAARAARRPA